jgi:leader peptidase (prepilin peptidase)/N-methyltransferase
VRIPNALLAAGVGAAGAIAVVHHDDATQLVLGLVLVAVLVPIAAIDLERRIIPNRITGPAAIAAIVLGLVLDPGGEPERLIAGVAAAAFFLVAALVNPAGMGMGDVKLAGVLGLFLGRAVAPALLVALVAGVVAGIVVVRRVGVRAGRKTGVPFGPFLALGGAVGAIAGDALMDAYLDRF